MKQSFKNIQISSVVACVPANGLDLRSLDNIYPKNDIEKIISITGIQSVKVAESGVTSSDLCEKAARQIIEYEKINPADIDALIFVSQTPDYILPQTSFVLQHKLGLPKRAFCLDVRIGCSGYIHGLFQACLLIHSGCAQNVLLLAGDTTTCLVNEKDRANRMVFGDAGSATMVKKGDGAINFSMFSDGSGADQLIIPAGGFRTPADENTGISKEHEEGNWRSENNLYMDGMGVFNFAITEVPPLINDLLETQGWNKNDVGIFALHQANKFIVDFLRKRIKVREEQVPLMFDGFGNTGPASIPLLFSATGNELKEKRQLDKVVMAGFGVGLSWGGATCDLSNTHFIEPIIY